MVQKRLCHHCRIEHVTCDTLEGCAKNDQSHSVCSALCGRCGSVSLNVVFPIHVEGLPDTETVSSLQAAFGTACELHMGNSFEGSLRPKVLKGHHSGGDEKASKNTSNAAMLSNLEAMPTKCLSGTTCGLTSFKTYILKYTR